MRIEIEMKKAVYQGIPWVALSEFQKRKYENKLFIQQHAIAAEPIQFVYV